jgi:hypothetical protein
MLKKPVGYIYSAYCFYYFDTFVDILYLYLAVYNSYELRTYSVKNLLRKHYVFLRAHFKKRRTSAYQEYELHFVEYELRKPRSTT